MHRLKSRFLARTSSIALAAVAAVSLGASTSYALGINCRGNPSCGFFAPGTAGELQGFVRENIDPNRFYPDRAQVVCGSRTPSGEAVCLFLQNTQGLFGSQIAALVSRIPEHGCTICGSVPTDFPNTNDVADGQLTMNVVTNPCVDGSNGMCL